VKKFCALNYVIIFKQTRSFRRCILIQMQFRWCIDAVSMIRYAYLSQKFRYREIKNL